MSDPKNARDPRRRRCRRHPHLKLLAAVVTFDYAKTSVLELTVATEGAAYRSSVKR